MKIYFDGGCSPNPGFRSCAVVMDDLKVFNDELGYGTNNEAEWLGFLWAVGIAETYKDEPVEILGDSMLVIMQAQGKWKCKMPTLRKYLAQFNEVKDKFSNLTLTHVKRDRNLAGIYIEKLQKTKLVDE